MIIAQKEIKRVEDFEGLRDHIPAEYLSVGLIGQFKDKLSASIKNVLIEYPYIDKDYRSTYYAFYAKRHRTYDQFCFRLHFFSCPVRLEKLHEFQKQYLGSVVLRPTEITPLGRTLLSPLAIKDFSGFVCEAKFENHILGVPFTVRSFPHITQDSDVTVCAHAVCWMIARYYSEKYTVYPERLTYNIVEAVRDVSFGRNIPSHGLTLGQVSEILSSIGFYPEIFVKSLYGQDEEFFCDILYSYVESGIPVVAAMHKKEHAIAIIGHGRVKEAESIGNQAGPNGFIPSRKLLDSLIANDDNCLPFRTVPFSGGDYCLADIDAFIVPLYEKMYLNAENVLKYYAFASKSPLLEITEYPLVARVYMTSSRSYKREIYHQNMHPDLQKAQLELPMPKFIWIVELSSPKNYDKQFVDYRFIIDSTANQYESKAFLLIHDKNKMIINDRALTGKIFSYEFTEPLSPYPLYKNNLKWSLA